MLERGVAKIEDEEEKERRRASVREGESKRKRKNGDGDGDGERKKERGNDREGEEENNREVNRKKFYYTYRRVLRGLLPVCAKVCGLLLKYVDYEKPNCYDLSVHDTALK